MAKGGYLILDLYKTPLTSGSATTIAGLWATLNKNKLKRVVLAGLYIGSALYNECDVEVKKDGTSFKFSAYGYDFTLTNADALTPVKNDSDIVLSKIKYDATNEELKIGATGKELLVGDDGDIHVNRDAYIGDEVVISSLQKIVDNDGTPFIPDSTGNLNKVLMHTTTGESWEKVGASSIDSGVATDGQVLKADGSGGVAWGDAGGGTQKYLHKVLLDSHQTQGHPAALYWVDIINESSSDLTIDEAFGAFSEVGTNKMAVTGVIQMTYYEGNLTKRMPVYVQRIDGVTKLVCAEIDAMASGNAQIQCDYAFWITTLDTSIIAQQTIAL